MNIRYIVRDTINIKLMLHGLILIDKGGPGKAPLTGLPEAYHGGLVGCIQHVRLNKRQLDLINNLHQDSTLLFCSRHE